MHRATQPHVYGYAANTLTYLHALLPSLAPLPHCSELLAFKILVAGDVTASRVRHNPNTATKAKGMSSGTYTFYKDDSAGIGAAATRMGPVSSIQDCLSLCDRDGGCALAVMTGITTSTSAPTDCRLMKGDSTVGTFKRGMIKTNLDRLSLVGVLGA